MSDQSPPAGTQTFNSAFPFNVALQNQFQGNDLAIIYITDTVDAAKPEQQINVSITQNDQQHYTLKGLGAISPSPSQFNLAIAIRPGTLTKEVADRFSDILKTALSDALPSNTCSVSSLEIRPSDGALLWYCAFKNDIDNATSRSLSFTLKGVTADAGAGSRSTKIEFLFDNLMLGGAANPLSFSRTVHVDIINHQGHTYAPMFFGVSGANTLLNREGHHNEFKIYLETIGRVPLAFGSNTEIVFSFPYADAASKLVCFGNLSEVKGYSLEEDKSVMFTADPGGSGGSACVAGIKLPILRVVSGKESDDGNGMVKLSTRFPSSSLVFYVFNFTNIQLSGDDGVVMLGVSIRNLPGYWDTDFQVPIIKATSTLNAELELGRAFNQGHLGTGSRIDFLSASVTNNLSNVSIEENWGLNLYGASDRPVKVKNADLQILEGGLSVSGATTLGATTVKNNNLRIDGAGNKNDTTLSLGGNGDFSVDAPGISSGRFVVKDGGNVGIGTASPQTKLEVNGDIKASNGRIQDKTGPVMPVGSIIAYAGEIFKIGAFDTEAYANANSDLKALHQADQAAYAKFAADMQAWNIFTGKPSPSPPPAPFDLFNHWVTFGIKEGRVGFININGTTYSGLAFGRSHTVDASCLAYANPPEGWLLCDGSPIPAAFTELKAVVGGVNTPNLCGRTLVGTGQLDDRHFNLNDADGRFQHTLTEAEMPKHAHQTDSSFGWQIDRIGGDDLNLMCQTVGAKAFDTGGNQPHNNMQPYFAVNYIIKC